MQYLSFPINLPISYVSCGNLVFDNPWIHSERVIDTYEVILGIEGEVYIQQDDLQYVVKPGSMLIILPNHPHKGYKPSSGKISFYWVHFKLRDATVLDHAAAESIIAIMSANPYSRFSQQGILPIFDNVKLDSKLDILFHQLLHTRKTPYYTSLAADFILTNILIQLTQNVLTDYTMQYSSNESSQSFESIIEWIRLNYNKGISTMEVAEKFHYNPNYFSKLFRSKTGMHLVEYLNTLSVSNAKTMLYQTNFSIKEIAYAVGFDDEKYFMKVFKRIEGITPTNYRNAFYRTYLNEK